MIPNHVADDRCHAPSQRSFEVCGCENAEMLDRSDLGSRKDPDCYPGLLGGFRHGIGGFGILSERGQSAVEQPNGRTGDGGFNLGTMLAELRGAKRCRDEEPDNP